MFHAVSRSRILAVLAWIGMSIPQPLAFGAETNKTTGTTRDVVLGPGGCLQGQVLNQAGMPQAARPVVAFVGDEAMGSAQTGADGRFVISGLRGGVYDLATIDESQTVRCWNSPLTAPPQAVSAILLSDRGEAIRGEEGELNVRRMKILTVAALGLSITALTLSVVLPIVLSDDPDAS